MTDVRSEIELYYEALLGSPNTVHWFEDEKGTIEVWEWEPDASRNNEYFVLATIGAFERLGKYPNLCEFHMGLARVPDGLPESLAVFASEGFGNGRIPQIGQIFTRVTSLWKGGSPCSFIVFGDGEPVMPSIVRGDLNVDFLWTIPITKSEEKIVKAAGLDQLIEEFESNGIEFWKPDR